MIKLAQTDQRTNRQTGQKQYVPHYYSGGHKKAQLHEGLILSGPEPFLTDLTILELGKDIMRTNFLSKFHDD
ncbi:hypothetical protein DPMN_108698 [Dreissena polymorpha]|uniref:Uncharacterized protein n=1 Tax=Dreissena polymorpha TaxID=45954 RepID=A0A9D4K9L4_DREPO|nr:hypothetical protein DPMN_108698 [Dreissena polymorpha]